MTNSEFEQLRSASPQRAHRVLFDEYCAYVYAIAASKLKVCGSREDIEECVSDIFAEVYRCCETIRSGDGELKPLIGTIAKRTAIDFYRRLSIRYGHTVSIEDDTVSQYKADTDIEAESERSELRRLVLAEVEKLGEPDSRIIIQQYFHGSTVKEIAERLSMSEAAVQIRSTRARQKLKKALSISGITG